jgi:hypothetical protein
MVWTKSILKKSDSLGFCEYRFSQENDSNFE